MDDKAEVLDPAFEVNIMAVGVEVSAIAGFRTGRREITLVVGLADESDRHALAAMLDLCAEAMREGSYLQRTAWRGTGLDQSNGTNAEGAEGTDTTAPF